MAHAFNADMVYSGQDTARARQIRRERRRVAMAAADAATGVYAKSPRGIGPNSATNEAFSPIKRGNFKHGFKPHTAAAYNPDSIYQKQYTRAERVARCTWQLHFVVALRQ